jgi:hypothetical protein
MIDVLSKLRTTAKKLLHEFGREPTVEEIAQAAEVGLEEARRVIEMGRQPMSLDRPVGESEDASFSEFVEDHGAESPTQATTNGLLKDRIDSLLKTLTYREREIIRLRYEGLVSLPAGFNTLRAVAHVGFVGGSDAAASCTVTARAEIGGAALTPDPQFLQSGNLNLGLQPLFTIEPNAPLPALVRGPPNNRSPMVLVDMPMRLTQLRTNSSLGTYALDPLNPGAYTLSVTVPGAPPAPADVTTQPALTALNAGLLNALMAVPAGQVYVTLSFYITLQSTDPATSVGVCGVRLVPE